MVIYLQAGQVEIEAQIIQAATDQARLAVPPRQAARKGVRLRAAEQRGKAAAAVLQGGPGPRRAAQSAQAALGLAQALLQALRSLQDGSA